MRIHTIVLKHFMRHDDTSLTLPAAGVVLVTGPNGHGKSSVVEAVAYGGWGATLRGTDPLQAGAAKGSVALTADQVIVRRGRAGKKTAIEWNLPGQAPTAYATNTKAQDALDDVIGPFDVWRRCCVFSSQDSSAFTLATDAERKRLLEDLLGLDRFDPALAACRDDLRAAQTARQQAEGDIARLRVSLAAEEQRIRDATEALRLGGNGHGDPDALRIAAEHLAGQRQAVDAELRDVSAKLAELAQRGGAGTARAQELARRLQALAAANCPTCDQPIPQVLRDALLAEQADLRQAAERDLVGVAAEREELLAEDAELREERDALEDRRSVKLAEWRTAGSRQQQATHQQGILDQAGAKLQAAEAALVTATAALAAAENRVALLGVAEKVLGLKGVRAHILGAALGGLEAVANAWLARIAAPGLTLHLMPYQEKAAGGVRDVLALEVTGAGGGHGYRAASGGERRRIDIAILLALAEVARAAAGADPGTLFCDEVFDALDADGVAAVAGALAELSVDRCVVVISHNPELAQELHPVAHYEVRDGKMVQAA